jgi:hypothetical protein
VVAIGAALLGGVGLVARVGTGGTATTTVDPGVLAVIAVAAAGGSLWLAAVVVGRSVRRRQ